MSLCPTQHTVLTENRSRCHGCHINLNQLALMYITPSFKSCTA